MSGIKRIILDVLVPLNTQSSDLALKLSTLSGVEGVDVLVQEVERKVEVTKITIEGDNIDFDKVKDTLDKVGASLQSIDRITCGKRIVG